MNNPTFPWPMDKPVEGMMNDKLTEALKQCPFCGSEVEMTHHYEFLVICKNPDCRESANPPLATESMAIAAWNRRTPAETVSLEAIDDAIERLVKEWGPIQIFCDKESRVIQYEIGDDDVGMPPVETLRGKTLAEALQLPTPQSVSTGEYRLVSLDLIERAMELCDGYTAEPGESLVFDELKAIASRPPVPSVVGVPSVETLLSWMPSSNDRRFNAESIHAHLLTSQQGDKP